MSNNIKAGRWSLRGMTALVTGGTRGLGHAIVEELAGLGAIVYTCSRNPKELNECLQNWEVKSYNVFGSTCDISQASQRENLIRKVNNQFNGKLNIFVNNVAWIVPKDLMESSVEDFSMGIGTNLEAPLHFCQLTHPLLKATGNGNVVFISSCGSFFYVPGHSIYSATKGAINSLAINLACEWAKDNIRVNAIAPWAIRTPLTEFALKAHKEMMEGLIKRTPQHRLAEPKEVSAMVAFLCFPATSFVTGQIMRVDGGASVYGL